MNQKAIQMNKGQSAAPMKAVSNAKPAEPDEQAEATAIISDMAKHHGVRAIQVLLEIATDGDSEAARVAACKELLDRGFGKVVQIAEGGGPGVTVINVVTGVRGRE